jgi:hypothetical protein
MQMPAIDSNVCSGWNEQDIALYNALPFFFAKLNVDRRKTWTTWNKFLDKRSWQPGSGDTMRGIRTAPSPHVRQFAFPRKIGTTPKKDVAQVREITVDANVYRHKFESPVMNFYPDFNNFLSHVNDHANDIMEKMERFEDIYYRGNIFHQAPFIFVCTPTGVKVIQAPYWAGTGNFNQGADGKSTAFLVDAIAQTTGNLSLASVNAAFTIMENDFRIPPFMGSGTPKDDQGLIDLFCLVTSSEAYSQFTFDPYLQANKNCYLDVVNQSFKGRLFGRVTCKLEDMSLRMTPAGLFKEPELTVDGPAAGADKGDVLPNPEYTDLDQSPYEVGFMVGARGYEAINVGPPPKAFTGDSPPENFPAMRWNGEINLTKRFLVPCIDDAGNTVWEANTYGEHIKFISQATYGIMGKQRRNIIPIFYKRKRGV